MAQKSIKGPRPKHIPQRTCIACRTTEAKRSLMRIVRDQHGRVAYDSTNKRAGRGAYLCHSPECWEKALKRRGLERALRIDTLNAEDVAALQKIADTLTEDDMEKDS
ncbi:MAG: YlxR family protein [Chloroflexi bacterium AL-W]|nr:YlxR family protein [Chloroflexi bacterium AL-N1]NOK64815.1 YlxR family protein [Chloroflexi bacterium AL-N10]NOK76585.1 YlxR family protein [Chloroflexi bacterium AL-N5]NOK80185.1 YlxR family protein [Chloroflexi bacterium AL-W]NOK86698.1 YlxR family protein [Chloroflexi bacterium AL-N15]